MSATQHLHQQSGAASIRSHLLLLVLAMAVPLALVVIFDSLHDRQAAVASIRSTLETQVSAMTRNTGTMLGDARHVLLQLAEREQVRRLDPGQCDPALNAMHSVLSGFTGIFTVNLQGDVVCNTFSTARGKTANTREREWFATALREQRLSIGMPIVGRQSGKLVSVISYPLRDRAGALTGFVALSLDLQRFDPNIASEALPEGTRYGFFAENGIMIWRNHDPENVIGTRPDAAAAREIVRVRDGSFESVGIDNVRRFFVVRSMPEAGWIAWIGVPSDTVYADANRNAAIAIAGNLAMVGLLFWLAIVLARRIARPIQALERSAQAIATGTLAVRTVAHGPEEIATVARTFNDMAVALEQNAVQLRIAATAFEADAPMVITDANGVIVRVNAACQQTTGYSPAEMIGQTPRLFKSNRHPPDFYQGMWQAITGEGIWHGEIWDKRKDGSEYPALLTITAVRDASGAITHFVGVQIEISERKRYEEAVYHMAFHDGLTHLPNRRLLGDRLEQALLACRRNSRHGALMFLDLDNFKPLNDTHGHEFGDLLLIEAANRLRTCVREIDTVARLGGDEFVVVLTELDEQPETALNEALSVAQKIRGVLAQPYELVITDAGTTEPAAPGLTSHQRTVCHQCTASIGVALFDACTAGSAEVLKRADSAMYAAKAAGRNCIRTHPDA